MAAPMDEDGCDHLYKVRIIMLPHTGVLQNPEIILFLSKSKLVVEDNAQKYWNNQKT